MKNCLRHADTVYVTPDMFGVYRNCEMRTPWLCGTNKDFYELVRRKHGSNKGTPLSPPARKHPHAAHVSRYTRRTIADRVREEIWIPCSSADTSKTKEHAPQPRAITTPSALHPLASFSREGQQGRQNVGELALRSRIQYKLNLQGRLVVKILGFYPGGPGSFPTMGTTCFYPRRRDG